MKTDTQKKSPSFRKKKRASNLLYIPVLVIVVIGILFFFVVDRNGGNGISSGTARPGILKKISDLFSHDAKNDGNASGNKNDSTSTTQPAGQHVAQPSAPEQPQGSANGSQALGQQPPGQGTSSPGQEQIATDPRRQAVDRINAFYTHLDGQAYMQQFHLEKSSKVYLTELIQKVLDNRPVIARETDDLMTVVKNTTHFFRILGKQNIVILKTILDREGPSIEDIMADYYTAAGSSDLLGKDLGLTVPPYALYDYAGFFLNTMGGRLYLFRRAPATRMLVTYYSILIIDKANQESDNREGIQIKPAVDSLIADIESSGSQLRYKDKYLDKLYDLKEKYQ